MIEVKEILRLWLAGHSLRDVTTLAGADRKTVRRSVQAAQDAGLLRDGGPQQLSDELLGAVVAVVRPDRPRGSGRPGSPWTRTATRSGPGSSGI